MRGQIGEKRQIEMERRTRERERERELAMIVAMSAPAARLRAGNNNRPSYRPCTPVIAVITASGLYRLSMQIAANYI